MKYSGGMVLECLKTLFLHLFSISEKKQEESVVRISLGQESFLEAFDIVVKQSKISFKNKECK